MFLEVFKLNLKNTWLIFLVFSLTLVPLKICSGIFNIAFVESAIFTTVFMVAAACTVIFSCFSEIKIKNIDIQKNYMLGTTCALVSIAFFLCISTYFNDTSRYDFEWQPVSMSLLSILCCISFIIGSVTFFRGINFFSSAPFFIFCPSLWFGMSMILFLSIYNNHADVYEVALIAFVSLFTLYHTQVFATSSNSNIIKKMFAFGMPSILLILSKSIPVIIKYFVRGYNISDLDISVSVLELLIAIYIIGILIECRKQIKSHAQNKFCSITIK